MAKFILPIPNDLIRKLLIEAEPLLAKYPGHYNIEALIEEVKSPLTVGAIAYNMAEDTKIAKKVFQLFLKIFLEPS